MIPKFMQPEVVPFVEVTIVPAVPDAPRSAVVDVTLVPAMFADPLPIRGDARAGTLRRDHAPTRCQLPAWCRPLRGSRARSRAARRCTCKV